MVTLIKKLINTAKQEIITFSLNTLVTNIYGIPEAHSLIMEEGTSNFDLKTNSAFNKQQHSAHSH